MLLRLPPENAALRVSRRTAGGHCRDHILRALLVRCPRLDITPYAVGRGFAADCIASHLMKRCGISHDRSPLSIRRTGCRCISRQSAVLTRGVVGRGLAIVTGGVLQIRLGQRPERSRNAVDSLSKSGGERLYEQRSTESGFHVVLQRVVENESEPCPTR